MPRARDRAPARGRLVAGGGRPEGPPLRGGEGGALPLAVPVRWGAASLPRVRRPPGPVREPDGSGRGASAGRAGHVRDPAGAAGRLNRARKARPLGNPMKTGPDTLEVVAAVVRRGGEILICQRPQGAHLGGLWEFPGGKIEGGESPEAALALELREELEGEGEVGPLRWETRHAYPDREVHLRFYDCEWKAGEGRDNGVARHAWVHPSRLGQFHFLPADAPLIRELSGEEEGAGE